MALNEIVFGKLESGGNGGDIGLGKENGARPTATDAALMTSKGGQVHGGRRGHGLLREYLGAAGAENDVISFVLQFAGHIDIFQPGQGARCLLYTSRCV